MIYLFTHVVSPVYTEIIEFLCKMMDQQFKECKDIKEIIPEENSEYCNSMHWSRIFKYYIFFIYCSVVSIASDSSWPHLSSINFCISSAVLYFWKFIPNSFNHYLSDMLSGIQVTVFCTLSRFSMSLKIWPLQQKTPHKCFPLIKPKTKNFQKHSILHQFNINIIQFHFHE